MAAGMHGSESEGDREKRKAAAKRERERLRKAPYRALQAAGGAVLPVPLKNLNAAIAVLLDLNWLALKKSEKRKEIAKAAGAMLDDLARYQKLLDAGGAVLVMPITNLKAAIRVLRDLRWLAIDTEDRTEIAQAGGRMFDDLAAAHAAAKRDSPVPCGQTDGAFRACVGL